MKKQLGGKFVLDGMRLGRRYTKGFTLMEVLVCIAMVGILFTPMLTLLSNSYKTNVNSKNTQRATTLSEQVMEQVRSYTSIQAMVNDTGWTRKSNENFVNNVADNTLTDEKGKYVNNKYFFVKDNLISDGKAYKAHVTVDCSKYYGNDEPYKVALSNLPVIESLGSDNSVLAVEANETEEALNVLEQKYLSAHPDASDIRGKLAQNLKKTVKVEVTDTVQDGSKDIIPDNMVRVRVYNLYSVSMSGSNFNQNVTSDYIYNDVVYYDNLKSIYLFYSYDCFKNNTSLEDTIFDGIDIDVNYDTTKHPTWNAGFTCYAAYQHIMVFTDYGNHLATGDEEQNFTNTLALKIKKKIKGSYSSATDQTNLPIISNLDYQLYDGTAYKKPDGVQKTDLDDFIETESVQRFADVTVELISKDDSKSVCTMQSTVVLGSPRGE